MLDRDYPRPIVDHEAAARQARERIWARRAEPAVRDEARAVFLKHGSRNPSREGVRRRSAKIKPITAAAPQIAQQADLFDMDEAGE